MKKKRNIKVQIISMCEAYYAALDRVGISIMVLKLPIKDDYIIDMYLVLPNTISGHKKIGARAIRELCRKYLKFPPHSKIGMAVNFGDDRVITELILQSGSAIVLGEAEIDSKDLPPISSYALSYYKLVAPQIYPYVVSVWEKYSVGRSRKAYYGFYQV